MTLVESLNENSNNGFEYLAESFSLRTKKQSLKSHQFWGNLFGSTLRVSVSRSGMKKYHQQKGKFSPSVLHSKKQLYSAQNLVIGVYLSARTQSETIFRDARSRQHCN